MKYEVVRYYDPDYEELIYRVRPKHWFLRCFLWVNVEKLFTAERMKERFEKYGFFSKVIQLGD